AHHPGRLRRSDGPAPRAVVDRSLPLRLSLLRRLPAICLRPPTTGVRPEARGIRGPELVAPARAGRRPLQRALVVAPTDRRPAPPARPLRRGPGPRPVPAVRRVAL